MIQSANLQQTPVWSSSEKILFRFSFIFFGIYIFPFPLNIFSHLNFMLRWYDDLWSWMILKTGKNVLHISYHFSLVPRGDNTAAYVEFLIIFLISVIGSGVWTILDRNRQEYNRLNYWFTTGLRYFLAFTMLSYGFVKLIKVQFPTPGLARLLEPYGQSSPHGLAWTFLGFSTGYNIFMGLSEAIGAILLLFRRTTTIGALLLITVTLNIVMINFCFGVPVKLDSSLYFLIACYITVPDVYRLTWFFLQRRESQLKQVSFSFYTKWKKNTMIALKTFLIAFFLYFCINDAIKKYYDFGDGAPKPRLYAYYNVGTFVKNGDTLSPLETDSTRWSKISFGERKRISVKMMNDTLITFNYKDDTIHHVITWIGRSDTALKYKFTYADLPEGQLQLKGGNPKDSLSLILTKLNSENFLLMNRGFRWIFEESFNR